MSETPTPETTTDGPSWSLMVPDDWELTETEGGVELQAKEADRLARGLGVDSRRSRLH
jgi:hypothetical protein